MINSQFLESIPEGECEQSDIQSSVSHNTNRSSKSGSSLRAPSRAIGSKSSLEGIRNNSLKKWWHIMGSGGGGSDTAGDGAGGAGAVPQRPGSSLCALDMGEGGSDHAGGVLPGGVGGPTSPTGAVFGGEGGDSIHAEHGGHRPASHMGGVHGGVEFAGAVNGNGASGGGGRKVSFSNTVEVSTGPRASRPRRRKIRGRRCTRNQLIAGSILLSAFLAIVIGLSVYFVANTGSEESERGGPVDVDGDADESAGGGDVSESPTSGIIEDGKGTPEKETVDILPGSRPSPTASAPQPTEPPAAPPSPSPLFPDASPTPDTFAEAKATAANSLLESISDPDSFFGGTPQNLAKQWITGWDEANLELDVGQPKMADGTVVSARRYGQRYALGVLYYSLGGTDLGDNDNADVGDGGRLRKRLLQETHRMSVMREDRASESNGPRTPIKRRSPSTKAAAAMYRDLQNEATFEPTNEPTYEKEATADPTGSPTPYVSSEPTDPPQTLQPVQESDPFRDSFTSTGGDDLPFMSPTHECRWHGIVCEYKAVIDPNTGKVTGDNEEIVVGIVLSSMGLIGSLPEEIGTLKSLEDLTLFDNLIGGGLPGSITKLKDLFYIDLGNNLLAGTVPLFHSELQYLYLNQNFLTGQVPAPGRTGFKLKHMWLDRNELSGAIPENIVNFEALESLILYHNSLSSSLPSTLESVSSLTYLDLSYNEFTGTLPDSFYSLTALTNVYLTGNSLSGPIKRMIGDLVGLQFLWLDSNEFSSTLRSKMSDLVELKSMLLQDNQFRGRMPAGVCNLFGAAGSLERLEADCEGDNPAINCTCCTKCF